MEMLFVIVLLVGGVFSASNFLIEKKKELKSLFDKIMPAKGIIGIVIIISGFIGLINVFNAFAMLKHLPILLIALLVVVFLVLVEGVLLSSELLIKKVLSSNENFKNKFEGLVAKIKQKELSIGLLSIGTGLLLIAVWLFQPSGYAMFRTLPLIYIGLFIGGYIFLNKKLENK